MFDIKIPTSQKKMAPVKFVIYVIEGPAHCQYIAKISNPENAALKIFALPAWGSLLIRALFLKFSIFI